MAYFSEQIEDLIEELQRLPGIGKKLAQNLALHLVRLPEERVEHLAQTILNTRKRICYCESCYTLTDEPLCPICRSDKRNHRQIMVVESVRDMAAYERTQRYEGVYHVLHGLISPLTGGGPSEIRAKELIQRLADVDEVIIATNSTIEGEATAMYLSKLILPSGIKVSRIASGIPVGGDLESADEVTLKRALEDRKDMH